MSILLVAQHRDMKPFRDSLLAVDPNLDIEIWPAVRNPERVNFAIAWNQPKNVFEKFPNLKVISSLGAGVDHLLQDDSIPAHIEFTRIVAPSLTDQMCDYIIGSAINILRKSLTYAKQQFRAEWQPQEHYFKRNISVGVMGLGELGKSVTERLRDNNFTTLGWSRSIKEIDGIDTYSGNELDTFLAETNMLVCLLPLTDKTDGIIDLDCFKKLNEPAFFINAGRGEHLVEEDLIYALDTETIKHAALDVFSEEPLPDSHPFWGRDKITITPHAAAFTDPEETAGLLVDNYKRMMSGQELHHKVDKDLGY